MTLPWNPGHLASRGLSCRDTGQHGTNPGHPGKSGTGGNPIAHAINGTGDTMFPGCPSVCACGARAKAFLPSTSTWHCRKYFTFFETTSSSFKESKIFSVVCTTNITYEVTKQEWITNYIKCPCGWLFYCRDRSMPKQGLWIFTAGIRDDYSHFSSLRCRYSWVHSTRLLLAATGSIGLVLLYLAQFQPYQPLGPGRVVGPVCTFVWVSGQ